MLKSCKDSNKLLNFGLRLASRIDFAKTILEGLA